MKMSLKDKMKQIGLRGVITIFILGSIDVFIIALPYYLKNFVPNVYNYYHIDETTFTQMNSLIGWVTLATQIPGGWLADKFSSRKLLSIGVILTAIGAIWIGCLALFGGKYQYSNFLNYQYYAIYVLWGISSTPFFWTPLWKVVSQQGTEKQQATVYGLEGAFNGIMGVIFVGILGAITFAVISSWQTDAKSAGEMAQAVANKHSSYLYAGFLFLFALFLIVLFFALIFYVKEGKMEKKPIEFKTLGKVLCDWRIWGLSFLVLGMYMFQSTFSYYLNQLLANSVGAYLPIGSQITTLLIVLTTIRIYGLRIVISSYVAKLSDHLRSFMFILLFVLIIGLAVGLIYLFIPGIYSVNNYENAWYAQSDASVALIWVVFILMNILFFFLTALSWVMVTLRYAQLGEVFLPKNSYGSAIALLSFIGYSSDAWFYQIGTPIIRKYQITVTAENQKYFSLYKIGDKATLPIAYQIMGLIAICVGLVGLLAGLAVYIDTLRFNKKHGIKFFRWRAIDNA